MAKALSLCALGFLLIFLDLTNYVLLYFLFWDSYCYSSTDNHFKSETSCVYEYNFPLGKDQDAKFVETDIL